MCLPGSTCVGNKAFRILGSIQQRLARLTSNSKLLVACMHADTVSGKARLTCTAWVCPITSYGVLSSRSER